MEATHVYIPAPAYQELTARISKIEQALARSDAAEGSADSRWLTQGDVEEILDVSRSTLHRLRKDGSIPFVQHGRKILFRREDVDAFLEDHLRAA